MHKIPLTYVRYLRLSFAPKNKKTKRNDASNHTGKIKYLHMGQKVAGASEIRNHNSQFLVLGFSCVVTFKEVKESPTTFEQIYLSKINRIFCWTSFANFNVECQMSSREWIKFSFKYTFRVASFKFTIYVKCINVSCKMLKRCITLCIVLYAILHVFISRCSLSFELWVLRFEPVWKINM